MAKGAGQCLGWRGRIGDHGVDGRGCWDLDCRRALGPRPHETPPAGARSGSTARAGRRGSCSARGLIRRTRAHPGQWGPTRWAEQASSTRGQGNLAHWEASRGAR
jgi:hypothetical protein